jgi:hypothetical protein
MKVTQRTTRLTRPLEVTGQKEFLLRTERVGLGELLGSPESLPLVTQTLFQ